MRDRGPCSSPFTADSLNQNPHTFRDLATDPAGNADPSPAERTFEVDKSVAGANVTLRATFVDDLGNRATSGNVEIKLKAK